MKVGVGYTPYAGLFKLSPLHKSSLLRLSSDAPLREIFTALWAGISEPITLKGPFLGQEEDECSMAEFCHLSQGIDVKLSVVRGYTERELNSEEIDLNDTEKAASNPPLRNTKFSEVGWWK